MLRLTLINTFFNLLCTLVLHGDLRFSGFGANGGWSLLPAALVAIVRLVLNPEELQTCKTVVFTAKMQVLRYQPRSAFGVKISAGGDVSLNRRS
jgi:hypothetical protein